MGYKQITVVTDGAGAGTATTTEYIEGEIIHVSIVYDAGGVPGGTSVVVDQQVPLIPIITVVGNVDGIWSPRAFCVDQNAANILYDALGGPPEFVRDRVYVCGPVTATIVGGGAATTNVITIVYKDYPSD